MTNIPSTSGWKHPKCPQKREEGRNTTIQINPSLKKEVREKHLLREMEWEPIADKTPASHGNDRPTRRNDRRGNLRCLNPEGMILLNSISKAGKLVRPKEGWERRQRGCGEAGPNYLSQNKQQVDKLI